MKFALTVTRGPADIPFAEHGDDNMCDFTGVSPAPEKHNAYIIIMGANQETYDPSSMSCVSRASCTANAWAPQGAGTAPSALGAA